MVFRVKMITRFEEDEANTEFKTMLLLEVEVTDADGTIKRYTNCTEPDGPTEWRVMDCIGCHNRPSHDYYDAEEAVKAVRADSCFDEEAAAGIADDLADLSADRAADIQEAGLILGRVYASNVFPSMNIQWGTYPDPSGHEASPGCHRCHAGDHTTGGGEAINDDCSACHTIGAWDEASSEILINGRGNS